MSDTRLDKVLSRPYRVLRLILEYPDKEFYLEDLHERSGISKMTLSRTLKKMVSAGLLKCKDHGYRKYFELRTGHLTSALKLLINLDSDMIGELIKNYRDSILIIYGSRVDGSNGPDSDWDLILIDDDEDRIRMNAFINDLEKRFGQTIDMKIYTKDQFRKIRKERSPFYIEVLSNMYVLTGDLNGLQ